MHNHLFSDIQEGAARNVALTYFLPDDDPMKYSFRTPNNAERAIDRTIKAGCPSSQRILEDCNSCLRNFERIIKAKGCYISDSGRSGVRDEARRESKEENIMLKSDPAAVERFQEMFSSMRDGNGLPEALLSRIEQKESMSRAADITRKQYTKPRESHVKASRTITRPFITPL